MLCPLSRCDPAGSRSTSVTSMEIASSGAFKDLIRKIIDEIKPRILELYRSSGMPQAPVPYDYSEEKGLDFKYTTAIDLWFGLGASSLRNAQMNIYIDNLDGSLKVRRAAVSAVVDDLYDFNASAEYPADRAARVQFGYGRNGELGPSGKIFWNSFEVDSLVEFDAVSLEY